MEERTGNSSFYPIKFSVPIHRIANSLAHGVKADSVTDFETLVNSNEYSYLVSISLILLASVGGQLFPVIFDTGSADLWVVSSSCADQDCLKIKKYAPTTGLVVDALPFSLNYLTGNAEGSVAFETIGFGTFEVAQQVFALANATTNMGLTSVGASGVLGLAFPDEASISGTVGRSLLDNIFASLEPSSRFLAYKLSPQGTDSSFSIGQLDPSIANLSSDIFFSPVYPAGEGYDYWKMPLQGLTINSQLLPFPLSESKLSRAPAPIAVLDSGTTLVLGPTRDVDNFWKAVGSAKKGSDGRWQVKCQHNVAVGFVLGSAPNYKEFVIDPADLSWQAPGLAIEDGWCVGGIQSNDGIYSGDWLLGDVFLRSVYVVHQAADASSPPAIGLLSLVNATDAQARFTSERGPDPSPQTIQSARADFAGFRKPAEGVSSFFILASALFVAFFLSGAFTFLFRAKRMKRTGRKFIK